MASAVLLAYPTVTQQSLDALAGTVYVESTNVSTTQTNMPFEFMVPIPPNQVQSGYKLVVKDGATTLDVQEDNHRTIDSDYRLIKVTGILPSIGASTRKTLTITREAGSPATGTSIAVSDITATDFEVVATCTIGGTDYTAAATDGLGAGTTWSLTGAVNHGKWRDGPFCTEYIVSVPLTASGPTYHSHLRAWFHISAYKASSGAVSGGNPITGIKCQVIIENGYYDVLSPADVTYNYTIDVTDSGTTEVVNRASFVHWYASRYRDVVWWGTEAEFYPAHDWDYIRSTYMIPNFDFVGADVGTLATTELDSDTAPFSQTSGESRGVYHNMGNTGDRPDISLAFREHLYGLARETYAGYRWIIESGEVAGWTQNHWRDDTSGQFHDPGALGTTASTWRAFASGASTGDKIEFPGSTANPFSLDQAHYPQLAYVPYLLTGDLYFAEECQFLGHYIFGVGDPALRQWSGGPSNGWRRTVWNNSNGENNGQQRLLAWNLRSVGHAAAVTPDTIDGTILGWSQSQCETHLNTNYDYLKARSVDESSSTDGNESGKTFAGAGAKFQSGGDSTEWGTSSVTGKYQFAPWQVNYTNLVNHNISEIGLISANGALYRDWLLSGVVDLCALTGWGVAKDWLVTSYYTVYYSTTRSSAGENNVSTVYTDIWDIGAMTMKTTGAPSGSKRAWVENDVGATLSATSGTTGTPITVTFDSAVFSTPYSFYAGKYIWQGTNGAGPGIGEIISVTSSTECTIRTDQTHPKNASYDGGAFDTTTFAAGEIYYPLPDHTNGTAASLGDGSGDKTYLQLSRMCVYFAADYALTGQTTAKTYIDSLAGNFTGLTNYKFHIAAR